MSLLIEAYRCTVRFPGKFSELAYTWLVSTHELNIFNGCIDATYFKNLEQVVCLSLSFFTL